MSVVALSIVDSSAAVIRGEGVLSVTMVMMDRHFSQTGSNTLAKTQRDYRSVQSTLTVSSAPPRVGRWITSASDAGTAGRRNGLHRAGSAA